MTVQARSQAGYAVGPIRLTPKSANTRARLVAGALKALEAHGLPDTTTRRIAAEAGVQLATLHYHFESKDAVLLAVLDALVLELTTTLTATAQDDQGPQERIATILRAAWAYAGETRAKQIVQYELTLYALRTRGSEWLAARQYQAYVDTYATLLHRGGTAVTAGAAEDLARFMLAGLDGLILQGLAGVVASDLATGLDALIGAAQGRVAPCGAPSHAG